MTENSLDARKIYYNIQNISFYRNIRNQDEFVTPEEWEERVRALEVKKSKRLKTKKVKLKEKLNVITN